MDICEMQTRNKAYIWNDCKLYVLLALISAI